MNIADRIIVLGGGRVINDGTRDEVFPTLVDTAGGVTARADGRKYVTMDASIHYLQSARKGRITATSHTVRRGRTVTVVDVNVTDEEERLLARGTVTMFGLDAEESNVKS